MSDLFDQSRLATFEKDGERWVALKPVVEGMGMSWGSQHTKLTNDRARFSCTDIGTTGSDGKRYEMTCIPLRRYPMWLATINPAKIPRPALSGTTFGHHSFSSNQGGNDG